METKNKLFAAFENLMPTINDNKAVKIHNEIEYNSFCQVFDGESNLKNVMPHLFESIQPQPKTRCSVTNEETSKGYQDMVRIEPPVLIKKNKFQITSLLSLRQASPIVCIKIEAIDNKYNEIIASITEYNDDASAQITTEIQLPEGYSTTNDQQKKAIIKVQYIWLDTENNLDGEIKSIIKTSEVNLDSGEAVDKITVDHPATRKGNKNILLVYQRTPQRPTYDYWYKINVPPHGMLPIHAPFIGSVTFNNYLIDESFTTPQNIDIHIKRHDKETGGIIRMDSSAIEKIKWTVSNHRQTLSWSFPSSGKTQQDEEPRNEKIEDSHSWGETAYLNLADLEVKTTLEFYAAFEVPLSIHGIKINQTVVVRSNDTEGRVGNIMNIKYLEMQWGCFARGTKIRRADGADQNIEEYRIGDTVQIAESRYPYSRIRNIWSGYEEELVVLKADGVELKITKDHPIMTDSGLMQACELRFTDCIMTERGAYAPIEWLFMEQYQDLVYNLELEEPGMLIANGFVTGDFSAQQKSFHRPKPQSSQKAMELAEELKRIMGSHE